jgi:geranylgeranyl diphosphate synthase, type I
LDVSANVHRFSSEPENSGRVRTNQARMHERVGRVFALLDELIAALPVPSNHRELLQVHLGQADSCHQPATSAVQLPLLVHEAITGDERPALPVAAACTLLYLGADLFDSILDQELPPSWHPRGSAEANLAAATLLAALPQLSIARLQEQGTPPAKLWALANLFADTLLTMSAGQYEDLLFPNMENVSLEDGLAMVERKSGSAGALLASAGAVLATEDPLTIEAYAAFGSRFGMAKQLINDVQGIWGAGTSPDLLNGKRTLPIAHALSTLRGEQRARLQELLAAARESAEHHDEARAVLAAAGSVRYTALMVWLHQEQARSHLAAASPQEPAGSELRMLLDRVSLLPQPEEVRPSD